MADEQQEKQDDPYADWLMDANQREPFIEVGRELGLKHAKEGSNDGVRARMVKEALTATTHGFQQGIAEALEGDSE